MLFNLSQITTPYYVAGVIWDNNTRKITNSAPVLEWTIGKTIDYLYQWCNKKKYKYQLLTSTLTIK